MTSGAGRLALIGGFVLLAAWGGDGLLDWTA
jgi:hypothetical protein